MSFYQKIAAVWVNVSLVQRALLIAITLTVVAVGVSLVFWARRPDMRVLYSSLDTIEAAKITEEINDKGISYKLANGGTTIYVPKEHVSQLRLEMAKKGLPESGQKGYGIFDDEKIGISPFVQNINLQRALQEELARSIQMIDGVSHVRIHLVKPERSLFASQTQQSSASIILRLKPGYRLSALNIAAITHLVAGSVEGLRSESVTVVDSDGHLLSSESDSTLGVGAGTVADYRERIELNLARKVEDMLTTVLGPGRATVKVSADINMTSISTIKESYEPKGRPIREEIKSGSETGAPTASADGTPIKGKSKKDETINTEFMYGKTIKDEVIPPGQIKSLTVAVFVDLYPDDPNETDPILAESDVEEIIRNALGHEIKTIKVVNVRFHRPATSLVDEEDAGGLDLAAIAGQASLGIMAVCALLVLKMFSGTKKLAPGGAIKELGEGEESADLLESGEEPVNPLILRREISRTLRKDPEQVKQLFASWIEEKEK